MLTQSEVAQRISESIGRPYRTIPDIAQHEPVTGGISIGLEEIDSVTGGLKPEKLNMVVGFAGHGKTTVMLGTAFHNRDLRTLIVSLDDTDDWILRKLLCFALGATPEEVEGAGGRWRQAMAQEHYPNIIIAAPQGGRSYSVDDVAAVYEHATADLGGEPELVILDYLGLVSGGYASNGRDDALGGIRRQAKGLKSFIRSTPETVWVVGHQCNRSAAGGCPALTLAHIAYGGEQEVDGIIIGCRRRIDAEELSEEERAKETVTPTINVSVMKNKNTGRRTAPEGVPYAIDTHSGMVRPLLATELPTRGRPQRQRPRVLSFPPRSVDTKHAEGMRYVGSMGGTG